MTATLRGNVRRIILESGWTDEQISRVVGVDRSNVCRWRNGVRLPKEANLLRFCAWSGCAPAELTFGAPAYNGPSVETAR